jgi:RNA polymerase sigma-70 factor (ECF subfamily)
VDEDAATTTGSTNKMVGPDVTDVVAAAAGDMAAFERVVRTMQGPVWRYLVHLVRDHTIAEDLSQEVFLRAHRKLHTLEDPERFVPWLFITARNVAYDHARARKRRPFEVVSRPDIVSSPSHDPHLAVEVRDALARLDADLREALVMVGLIGLTYQEAADAIGVPEGTVKSRTFRARKQLLEILGPEEDDDH